MEKVTETQVRAILGEGVDLLHPRGFEFRPGAVVVLAIEPDPILSRLEVDKAHECLRQIARDLERAGVQVVACVTMPARFGLRMFEVKPGEGGA